MKITAAEHELICAILDAVRRFERAQRGERVRGGMQQAKTQGRPVGRPRQHYVDVARARELLAAGRSLRATARVLGVHPTAISRALVPGVLVVGP